MGFNIIPNILCEFGKWINDNKIESYFTNCTSINETFSLGTISKCNIQKGNHMYEVFKQINNQMQ